MFFQGRSEGDNIVLEWKTATEESVQNFAIERKAINSHDFTTLSYISPKGNNSLYTYTDENVYKATSDIYYYRLAIYEKNNPTPSHSSEISVTHNPSDVRRTWGSIKAMFR
ncbi:MAG: hypothetical protein NTX22_03955 [Ignavibacteriales bacterium]|nr:hypothetical protein [Ignavibacteriales bacterium]